MENLILPQRMRELRQQNHYTQKHLSARLNIGREAYSNYETGRRSPSLDIIIDLARFYHVSLDYLLLPEDEDLLSVTVEPQSLSRDEYQLLSSYRALSAARKREIADFAQFLKKKERSRKQ